MEAIRAELRPNDYIPILFYFEVPNAKDIHETVVTLASLVRFVGDIKDPESIPQELAAIAPGRPSLALVPLLQSGAKPWSMFSFIQRFSWVLPVREYPNVEVLLKNLSRKCVGPSGSEGHRATFATVPRK